jgi:hypothetical protein
MESIFDIRYLNTVLSQIFPNMPIEICIMIMSFMSTSGILNLCLTIPNMWFLAMKLPITTFNFEDVSTELLVQVFTQIMKINDKKLTNFLRNMCSERLSVHNFSEQMKKHRITFFKFLIQPINDEFVKSIGIEYWNGDISELSIRYLDFFKHICATNDPIFFEKYLRATYVEGDIIDDINFEIICIDIMELNDCVLCIQKLYELSNDVELRLFFDDYIFDQSIMQVIMDCSLMAGCPQTLTFTLNNGAEYTEFEYTEPADEIEELDVIQRKPSILIAIIGKNMECIRKMFELSLELDQSREDPNFWVECINLASSHGTPEIIEYIKSLNPNIMQVIATYCLCENNLVSKCFYTFIIEKALYNGNIQCFLYGMYKGGEFNNDMDNRTNLYLSILPREEEMDDILDGSQCNYNRYRYIYSDIIDYNINICLSFGTMQQNGDNLTPYFNFTTLSDI